MKVKIKRGMCALFYFLRAMERREMMILGKPEIVKNWAGKDQNVYRREVLYQEIWNFPVTEVAKKYAVSDVTIHKVCREMEIPTPPVGYWAKKQSGKEVSIPPLPPSSGRCIKFGLRSQKQSSLTSPGNAVGMTATIMDADAAHKYEEERKRKEEHRRLYNEEVAKTNELLNQVDDYEIACKIRAMVAVEERKGTADTEWIAWAKAKADWFDPTVAASDKFFGRRNHKRGAEQKILKER